MPDSQGAAFRASVPISALIDFRLLTHAQYDGCRSKGSPSTPFYWCRTFDRNVIFPIWGASKRRTNFRESLPRSCLIIYYAAVALKSPSTYFEVGCDRSQKLLPIIRFIDIWGVIARPLEDEISKYVTMFTCCSSTMHLTNWHSRNPVQILCFFPVKITQKSFIYWSKGYYFLLPVQKNITYNRNSALDNPFFGLYTRQSSE